MSCPYVARAIIGMTLPHNVTTSLIVSLEKYRLSINLAGDYNLNLLKINNDELCSEFFDLITSHSLLPQITLPTRLSQISGTLIDTILCKAHIIY